MSVHRAALRQQLPSSFICRPAVLGHAGGGEGGREWGEGGAGERTGVVYEQRAMGCHRFLSGWRVEAGGAWCPSRIRDGQPSLSPGPRASPEPQVAAAAG